MAAAPVVLLDLLEHQQKHGAVESEEVDMPRQRSEEVEAGQRRVEEEVAERELEDDSREDEGVGEKVQPYGMPPQKVRHSLRPSPQSGQNLAPSFRVQEIDREQGALPGALAQDVRDLDRDRREEVGRERLEILPRGASHLETRGRR